MDAGAVGLAVVRLLNLAAFASPFPQLDVYITLTLSPINEAESIEYKTLITLEVTSPESITAFAPSLPVNDHNQPVGNANEDEELVTGSAGAE